MSDDNTPHLPRWRALMDVGDAMRLQMRAVKAAERLMYDAYERGDREACRKAANTVTQASRAYVKMAEVHELEARVERLERLHERLTNPETNGTPADA
jgi:hypothetical protein